MVLIQTLTVDAINTALIALQRGQSIVIGGDKGQTVNNINVTNKTESADYSEKIKELTRQIETLKETDTALKAEDVRINDRLNALTQLGISDFTFDDNTRELTIELTDGNVYTTIIRPVPFILSLSGSTLILENEYQREEVELPFILLSQKGAANGVATLDATGRVPYSQLPESAMEFKGEWNANTNTPHLQDGTGTNGDFYICSQGGTVNFGTVESPRNITFYVNDRAIYQGDVGQWKRLPASEVRTVNGQSGDVVLNGTNVNYSDANNSPTLKAKIDTVEGYAKTQSNWTQSDTSAVDYIKNKPNLATVATSGSYNDLSNKPTIPAAQIQSNWTQTNSSSKDFIKNKIPIWITSGSADDNMTPIDSVTDGSLRPVTSNAVYDGLATKLGAVNANGFWGMATPSGATNDWIRTTNQGIIPYQSGNSGNGHQTIGTSTWYFSGAYIDTVNAVTVNANGYQLKRYYEINASSLSSSNFYPVTFASSDLELDCEIHSPSGSASMAYNQNYIHFLLISRGWSDTPKRLDILHYAVYSDTEITIGCIGTGTQDGVNCIWVRGGRTYRFYCNKTPTLRTSNYTSGNEVFTVGTNYSGGTNSNVTVQWTPNGVNSARFSGTLYASLSGDVAGTSTNATKLGNISVQTSSIGGTTTETGNHWAYITKAKFTTTSGYIVYSNGLCIQWGRNISKGNGQTWDFPLNAQFTQIPMVVGNSNRGHNYWNIGTVTTSGVTFYQDSSGGTWDVFAIGY